MKGISMDVNEIKEAKSLYNSLVALAKEKADLEVLKRQREDSLKFEVAVKMVILSLKRLKCL